MNYGLIHRNKPHVSKCMMKHIVLIRVHNLFRKLTNTCTPLSFYVGPPPTSKDKMTIFVISLIQDILFGPTLKQLQIG